ncbi:MAG: FAD-dependent oxidoreductase, partial [Mesotoga sp.]
MRINVIGGGLAGSEAALSLANYGNEVVLYEMRPAKNTEVHH